MVTLIETSLAATSGAVTVKFALKRVMGSRIADGLRTYPHAPFFTKERRVHVHIHAGRLEVHRDELAATIPEILRAHVAGVDARRIRIYTEEIALR